MSRYLLIFSLLIATGLVGTAQPKELLPCMGKEQFYQAQFNLMGTRMNGYMAVRQRSGNVLHVALTSPMGNNLLEMRWKKGRWKKISAIDKLNNKRLFRMLGEDLLLLFGQYRSDKGFQDLGDEWSWNGKRLFPKWDNELRLVSLKVVTRRHLPSRTVKYSYSAACLAQMSIDHQGFPFSIVLQPVDKN